MRPIHHTFAPLADKRQCLLALKLLCRPWRWKSGPEQILLEGVLSLTFGGKATLFASGRQALLAGLQAAGIGEGDEVIVQAYTCVVVPNAVEAAGAKTVFADIDRDTLNLNMDEVRAAITPRTKAIVCQHTFGIPADSGSLREICDEKKILFIEDCAHILPDDRGPKEIGKLGDMLIFSFGRDKAISGVAGGALIIRGKAATFTASEPQHDLSLFTIKRLLLYPLFYAKGKLLYAIGLGKISLWLLAKLHLLLPITNAEEKRGIMHRTLERMPNACAALALDQWHRLRSINDHRRMLTSFYRKEGTKRGWWTDEPDSPLPSEIRDDLPLQKFPLFLLNADGIRAQLKRKNIHLDDGWTGCVICPRSVTFDTGYVPGSDPQAEALCEKILSLPTHPTMTIRQAERLVGELESFLKPKA